MNETDAEKGTGFKGAFAWNHDTAEFEMRDEYSWRATGFAQRDNHPVVNVSWNDAAEFCKWLSREEKMIIRLPTEAEWEYACRAGTTTDYYSGNEMSGNGARTGTAWTIMCGRRPMTRPGPRAARNASIAGAAGSIVPAAFAPPAAVATGRKTAT